MDQEELLKDQQAIRANQTKDWSTEIPKELIIEDEGKKFVLLEGLRIIARKRGYYSRRGRITDFPNQDNIMTATAEFTYHWLDGSTDTCVADANSTNIKDEPFNKFLSVMAVNRAEAITIRTAMGINMNAVEELDSRKGRSKSKSNADIGTKTSILPQQKSAIIKLVNRKNIEYDVLLSEIGINSKETSSIDFQKILDNLTEDQASQALAFLNK